VRARLGGYLFGIRTLIWSAGVERLSFGRSKKKIEQLLAVKVSGAQNQLKQ
jgi:hypothetical protein